MRRISMLFMLTIVLSLTMAASEPFIGTVRTTRGRVIKGVKVYVDNPKKTVKSDKNGEFKIEDLNPGDSLHIVYNKSVHSIVVDDRKDMTLVIGDDGRVFENDNYVGETFHGHIVDYKGKPVRGAIIYSDDPFDYVKSDIEGKFLIDNIIETDTIHIKHNGYIHDIAMDGSKGMFIKIMREGGRRTDGDFVDTGTGRMDARSYNGPRSVMTAEQLEKTGTQNLIEAMSGMSGVMVTRDPQSGRMGISIRFGGAPLWIVDGSRMEEAPEISVMEVERIEVLHDGGGYGLGAWGGVINITTKGSHF